MVSAPTNWRTIICCTRSNSTRRNRHGRRSKRCWRRAVLDYRANPAMLLDDDKFDAINARRGELVLGPEAVELLKRSETAIRRRRTLVRGGMALVAGLAVILAVQTTAIFGVQSELKQKQTEVKSAQVAATAIAAEARASEARAVEQQQIAQQQRRAALARQLILRTDSTLAARKDQNLALLLAIQSAKLAQQYDSGAILDSDMALKRALLSAPRKVVNLPIKNEDQSQLARPQITLDESGRYLVISGSQPAVRVLDAQSGDLLWHADVAHEIRATAVVSNTASLMAFLADGELLRWDLSTGGEPQHVRVDLGSLSNFGSVALSPAGTHLAVEDEGDGQTIYLIDAVSGAHLRTYRSETLIQDLKFNSDGSLLAFVGALDGDQSSSRVHVVDVATRAETVMPVDGYAVQAQFGPDSNSLFVSFWVEGLAQINIQKRQIASIIPDVDGSSPPIFSPDGRLLAYSTISSTLILRNATTGNIVAEFGSDIFHGSSPAPLAFQPGGDRLMLSGGKLVSISKRAVQDIAFDSSAYWAQFTPNGRQVWLASDAGVLWLAAIAEGELVNGAVVLPDPLPSGRIALNDTGNRALTQDQDNRIRLWDLDAMQEISIPISTITPANLKGTTAKWEHGFMVLAGPIGIWLLDEAGGAVLHQFPDFRDTCNVTVSPDGTRLLIVDRKAGGELWDLRSGKQIALLNTVPKLCSFFSGIEFSSESRFLAMSDYSSGAYLVNTSDGRVVFSKPGHGPREFGFSPDGQRAVLTMDTPPQAGDTQRKNEILIIKPDTGELIASLSYPKPTSGVHHLALSNSMAAVSLGASPIYLIATASGEALDAIDAQENVGDFWFGDPDTMFFLPASDGLRIWNLSQPDRPYRVGLPGGQTPAFAPYSTRLTFAADRSRYALSDLEMAEIRDARDGKLLAITSLIATSAEAEAFMDNRFSSDLSKMATVTADGMLRVWPTDIQALIRLACRTIGRDF